MIDAHIFHRKRAFMQSKNNIVGGISEFQLLAAVIFPVKGKGPT
jgi:hypothetical protein